MSAREIPAAACECRMCNRDDGLRAAHYVGNLVLVGRVCPACAEDYGGGSA